MTEFNINLADEVFTVRCVQPFTRTRFVEFETDERGAVLQSSREMMLKYLSLLEKKYHANSSAAIKIQPNLLDFFSIFELVSHALVPRGVLLVHGSAVVVNGQAVLFMAPSGTGKSTHTHLWTELLGDKAFIINDDKQFIRLNREVPIVYTSPWGMVHPAPAEKSAPLKAVVWLERGENHIEPITFTEMLPKLIQSSLRGNTPAEAVQILQMQQKLLRSASLWKMTCTPDLDAAHMAYHAVLEKEGDGNR